MPPEVSAMDYYLKQAQKAFKENQDQLALAILRKILKIGEEYLQNHSINTEIAKNRQDEIAKNCQDEVTNHLTAEREEALSNAVTMGSMSAVSVYTANELQRNTHVGTYDLNVGYKASDSGYAYAELS